MGRDGGNVIQYHTISVGAARQECGRGGIQVVGMNNMDGFLAGQRFCFAEKAGEIQLAVVAEIDRIVSPGIVQVGQLRQGARRIT